MRWIGYQRFVEQPPKELHMGEASPRRRRIIRAVSFLALVACATLPLAGQTGTQDREWRTYGGDLASTRYSPLDQINAQNFGKLEVAWRFKTANLGPRVEYNLQATPLVIKGVMYFTAGTRRAAVAVDALTGEMLWMHSLNEGKRGESAPRQLSGRGLSYWTDGRGDERILYVTPGYQLIALNAKTGARIERFGNNGIVDLKQDNDQPIDLVTGEIGLHSAPVVSNDIIIIGAAHLTGRAPKSKTHEKGYVRGFDVRTGKRVWIFHTIPRPGEFGNDTWENDSWSYTGNAGSWAQMSVDEELGLAYLPIELATGDQYGGHRPGNNLFAESLVAVDIKTGKRKWHYQTVHHGIWDMDIPAAPILCDIVVDGKPVKAVAIMGKQAFLYVLNRVTGEPVWPIVERPVEQSDIPGEKTSPTQPFPTKPPPFALQGITVDDLIDFTPELRAEALKIASNYKMGPVFTPPVINTPERRGTLVATLGSGANWPGGSYDPETHMLYVFANQAVTSLGLVKPTEKRPSDMDWIGGVGGGGDEGGGGLSVQGLPLIKPPYGLIAAVNMDKGELVWQIPHGDTPDNIKNHPALKGLNIPRTGRSGRVGTLVTKTLLIAGEGGFVTTPYGRGAMLRAYDKATGKDIAAVYLPAPATGAPMTYMLNGRQYLAIAVGGPGYPSEMLVFRAPL
jgi:quinoprotein glucose dehydrogenase